MHLLSLSFLITLSMGVSATPRPRVKEAEMSFNTARTSLRSPWYRRDDDPLHGLFSRQVPSISPSPFPAVGSPEWAAGFPNITVADTSTMPKAWTDALNVAIQSGRVPSNIPVSKLAKADGVPSYAGFPDPSKLPICSSSQQCRIEGQIWDAPDGFIGISFDDGPLPPSDLLYPFLQQNQIPSTHFFIGSNILQYPNEFMSAFATLHSDIAVHTWTHPYMTTLTNEQVIAELGWTMQLIYNSTGGRIPRYWRPPYGDSDVRVCAIAKEVFGLTTVIWNQDTNDWMLDPTTPPGPDVATPETIAANFDKWLSGPKSPGLIILEHELLNATVQAFQTNYPKFKQNGWNIESLAQIQGASYQNAHNSTEAPLSAAITAGGNGGAGLPTLVNGVAAAAATANASASSTSAASAASATASVHANGAVAMSHSSRFIAAIAGFALALSSFIN